MKSPADRFTGALVFFGIVLVCGTYGAMHQFGVLLVGLTTLVYACYQLAWVHGALRDAEENRQRLDGVIRRLHERDE